MCGIVGVAGSTVLSKSMEDLFKNLLFLDTLRGAHATGVASINTSTADDLVAKAAVSGPEFLVTADLAGKVFDKARRHNILIGHNRFATRGAKDKTENAHPFSHGKLVGVHNGSLIDQSLLDDHKTFEVDSDNLYYHLNKNGLKHTIENLNGAFALVWYDREDNSLNFIRNGERPLCLAKMRSGEYVWASEEEMLRFLVDREATLAFAKTSKGQEAVYSIPKYTHIKIPFKSGTYGMGEPEYKEYKEPKFEKFWAGYGNDSWGSYSQYRQKDNQERETEYARTQATTFRSLFPHSTLANAVLQVKFLGIETVMNKDWETKIAIFDFVKTDGRVLKLHHYVHSNSGIVSSLEDRDVGSLFYAQVSHLGGYYPTTPEIIKNGDLNVTISIKNVSRLTSRAYFPYNNHVTRKDHTVPAKQEKAALLLPAPTDEKITLANAVMDKAKFLELVKESRGHCWNCCEPMLGKPPASAYMYSHFDSFASEQVTFLLCSKTCKDRVRDDMLKLDRAYEDSFGEINA